jgi:uncharacterized protein DUF6763
MPIEEEPVVGAAYENEEGRKFAVIAFDEDEGTIDVQYEDETVNQIDLDTWYEMELTRVSSPENDDEDEDETDDDDLDEDEDDDEDDLDDDDDEEE